jgi:hypothetical protein
MLRNAAAILGCRIPEGETGEVDGVTGKKLVALGLAICLDEPPKPMPVIQAVPDPPVIADPKPPKIQTANSEPKTSAKAPILKVKPQAVKETTNG